MTVFFALQTAASEITITRSDDYPFKDYMRDGLRRLPTVTQLVDYGPRLVLTLEPESTLTPEAVERYTNQLADDYGRQRDEAAAKVREIAGDIERLAHRVRYSRTAFRRQPRRERAHWSDADAGMFDIFNPFKW